MQSILRDARSTIAKMCNTEQDIFANQRGGVVLEKGNIIMCIKSYSHHINILLNVHIAGTYK